MNKQGDKIAYTLSIIATGLFMVGLGYNLFYGSINTDAVQCLNNLEPFKQFYGMSFDQVIKNLC